MIPIFYVTLSIGATAILCLLAGAIGGVRLWNLYTRSLDRMLSNDKYRNTAGAIWLGDKVICMLNDGATTSELLTWLDKRGDELVENLNNPDYGDDIVAEWQEDPPDEDDDSQETGHDEESGLITEEACSKQLILMSTRKNSA